MSLTTSHSSSRPAPLLAFFGGTFDPIHYGHLKPVTNLAGQAGFDQVILLPNNVPPHRPQPEASSQQRLYMVELAVAGNPLFSVDSRELNVDTPSYTIETLATLRKEHGDDCPLAFIIGQDSLLTLHKWHRWESLLDFCHLVVMARPGYQEQLDTPALQRWYDAHRVVDAEKLKQKPAGFIYQANTPLIDISATEIRERRHAGLDCSDLLPSAVERYIESQGLYRE
ncbi:MULTISPECIES: nicotinate-nucleotide adenylyltransferase [Rahnella]|jgi:nicotinate-nucleotide adenylyltransferase|uniref:Probable nicotinate-nucleotide adenylyltransferase n=1 Tax=Rahnella contaminans TaxID=2703882 RepID=A0A6M2B6A8_9GAMM|nr:MULTISPECIES: nicotinate-nucleotide adenylyltransferase [Rahnella]KAB8308087.1 nicotinate-nucleotide adenylyltransferase [Rouxiella chamberiensis]MBU9819209.1 nicotinate-nucleotide adenylyltransferase [Rahnella sp. BCC 1045]NGX88004.1 nicotinate-nucleotide adenylyltransferase [Rahnella contaminans]